MIHLGRVKHQGLLALPGKIVKQFIGSVGKLHEVFVIMRMSRREEGRGSHCAREGETAFLY